MDRITIEFEWISPEGARGPELRATWAYLRIRVGNEVVTRVEDTVAHSVRLGVYGPLYPLAEWIVSNWWSLLHEVMSPKRKDERDYALRHDVGEAAEGYALPSLRCQPEGERTALVWRKRDLTSQHVCFLDEGHAVVSTRQLEDELRSFICAVVTRLEDEGVADTFLAAEWNAINAADADEQDYCRALGRLGLDPYAPESELIGHAVIGLSEQLPAQAFDEFLAVANARELETQGNQLLRFFTEARTRDIDVPSLRALKEQAKGLVTEALDEPFPWDRGYAFARGLRALLGTASANPVPDVGALGTLFQVQPDVWENVVTRTNGMSAFLSAAVGRMRNDAPCFAIKPVRTHPGQVFLLCRALYEYLATPEPAVAVVTEAHSERQKRSRAFAAEFLAPAAQLAALIDSAVVTHDDIEDLAARFGVSAWVIRLQIANHQLATLPFMEQA